MSTFLELVGDLHRESGSGGSAPTAVTGQSKEALRLVNWIRQADHAIQNMWSDWRFLLDTDNGSFSTVADTKNYAKQSDLAAYDLETFRLDGEAIYASTYIEVRSEWVETDTSQPYRAVIMPDDQIRLDQTPNGVYAITYDYWKVPTLLAADGDISAIPPRFHYGCIVGLALQYYGSYENAPDAITHGQELYMPWIERLESSQLPGDRGAHAKAEDNRFTVRPE